MEKAGSMFGNKNMEQKGLEKREEKGFGGADTYGSGSGSTNY